MIVSKAKTETFEQFFQRLVMLVADGKLLQSEAEDSYGIAYREAYKNDFRESYKVLSYEHKQELLLSLTDKLINKGVGVNLAAQVACNFIVNILKEE